MCSILFVDWFVVGFNRCLPRRRFRCESIKMFSNGLRRKELATKRASTLFCGLSVTLRFNWLIDPRLARVIAIVKAVFLVPIRPPDPTACANIDLPAEMRPRRQAPPFSSRGLPFD